MGMLALGLAEGKEIIRGDQWLQKRLKPCALHLSSMRLSSWYPSGSPFLGPRSRRIIEILSCYAEVIQLFLE